MDDAPAAARQRAIDGGVCRFIAEPPACFNIGGVSRTVMNSVNSLFAYRLVLVSSRFRARSLRTFRRASGDSGFSLLEMVVVVAILGILVAVQLPNVLGHIEKAKLTAAQAQISNAITECATAKINGVSERELSYVSPAMMDLVPALYNDPPGYKWERIPAARRGCFDMRLKPVDRNGKLKRNEGYPMLMAKIASGGRIIKVADWCRPFKTIDFTKECMAWDPTMNSGSYRTTRNLKDPNWVRKL